MRRGWIDSLIHIFYDKCLKCTIWCFDIGMHSKRITIVKKISISFTSHTEYSIHWFIIFCLRQGLTLYPKLTCNSLCSGSYPKLMAILLLFSFPSARITDLSYCARLVHLAYILLFHFHKPIWKWWHIQPTASFKFSSNIFCYFQYFFLTL